MDKNSGCVKSDIHNYNSKFQNSNPRSQNTKSPTKSMIFDACKSIFKIVFLPGICGLVFGICNQRKRIYCYSTQSLLIAFSLVLTGIIVDLPSPGASPKYFRYVICLFENLPPTAS